MTGERHIDYETLAQSALRGIVRSVLQQVAKSGLPGQHHFYIAFNTTAPGVVLSPRLKQRYPEEMTIVLQHRFRGLAVSEKQFEVELSFDGIPERLVVPFAAVKVFFDPSVPYGLQFEGSDLTVDATHDVGAEENADTAPPPRAGAGRASRSTQQGPALPATRSEKKPRAPRKARTKEEPGEATKGREEAAATTREPRSKVVTTRPDQPDVAANDTKVIRLDQFRKNKST